MFTRGQDTAAITIYARKYTYRHTYFSFIGVWRFSSKKKWVRVRENRKPHSQVIRLRFFINSVYTQSDVAVMLILLTLIISLITDCWAHVAAEPNTPSSLFGCQMCLTLTAIFGQENPPPALTPPHVCIDCIYKASFKDNPCWVTVRGHWNTRSHKQ